MKFRSDEDGYITGAALLQAAEQHGHARRPPLVRHRPAARGGARSPNETASGWQQVDLPEPGADHEGHHLRHLLLRAARAASRSARASSTRASTARRCTRPARRPTAATASTGTAPARFPDQTFNATNYWVDATFDRTIPPDTRGPDRDRRRRPRPAPSDVAARRDVTADVRRADRRRAAVTGTDVHAARRRAAARRRPT